MLYEFADKILPILGLTLIGVFVYFKDKKRLLDYVLAVIISVAVSEIVKYFVNLPRPTGTTGMFGLANQYAEGSSFPSTHTVLIFTAAFFYLIVCHKFSLFPAGRAGNKGEVLKAGDISKIALSFLIAITIALSRWVFGIHSILDLFVGILVGLVVSVPFRYYDIVSKKLK